MSLFDYLGEAYEIEPSQRLMLESLILPSPQDEESFTRWLGAVDFHRIDGISIRLVPALLEKFGGRMSGSGQRVPMRSIYRLYQFKNSVMFAAGHRVMESLLDAGIDVLLFKGIALSLKYYRNSAVRPMADLDILVKRENVPQVEGILRQHGYRYGPPAERKITDIHSHDYVNDRLCGIDLHWYALYESVRAGIDDAVWQRAEFFDWDGVVVRIMSPEDLLLTSIVSGVRDSPMRPHWIHDVATIVSSEPIVRWNVLWDEARKRGLHLQVLDALSLADAVTDGAVPSALFRRLAQDDPGPRGTGGGGSVGTSAAVPGRAALRPPPVGRVRYSLDDRGSINALDLEWRHFSLLPELFEVTDRQQLANLAAGHAPPGRGWVNLPAGLVKGKAGDELPAYTARISVVDGAESLALSPHEVAEITVEVSNTSPCAWSVAAGSARQLGVSYHLLSEDGATLVWDWPRTYFLKSRASSVCFIEASQALTCIVRIVAPERPGRYIVQLDLVREHDRWFHAHLNPFARLRLEVVGDGSVECRSTVAPGIEYELLDGETAIVNTAEGVYYTVGGYGSLIWRALADGYPSGDIVRAFAAAGAPGADGEAVARFIDALAREGLIVSAKRPDTGMPGEFRVSGHCGTHPPVLTRHGDARELLRRHPVLGSSALSGWPHPPDAEERGAATDSSRALDSARKDVSMLSQALAARDRELDGLRAMIARSMHAIDGMLLALDDGTACRSHDDQRREPGAAPRAAAGIDRLLTLRGGGFVDAAYRVLLHREPDPEGRRHYMDELRRGISHAEIARRIRYSPEGRRVDADIRPIQGRLAFARICRIPLLGRLLEAIGDTPGLSASARRRRALEHALTEELERVLAADLKKSESLVKLKELLGRIETGRPEGEG